MGVTFGYVQELVGGYVFKTLHGLAAGPFYFNFIN